MYALLNSPSRQCAIIRTLELLPDMHSIVNHLHIHQIPSFDLCVDYFNLHLIPIHFIEPGLCRVPRLPFKMYCGKSTGVQKKQSSEPHCPPESFEHCLLNIFHRPFFRLKFGISALCFSTIRKPVQSLLGIPCNS